jgi:PAP2 superfamily
VSTSRRQATVGGSVEMRRGPRTAAEAVGLTWWREVLLLVSLYLGYEVIRNVGQSSAARALANAESLLALQESLGLNVERALQRLALPYEWLIELANSYYGLVYSVATLGTLVWLYQMAPDRYRFWRNALLITTTIGLVGFYLFPLAPPRLLDTLSGSTRFGYVDTLATLPGPWSFQSPWMSAVSNQYAAMPSLHCAWALWTAAAVSSVATHRLLRIAVWLLPVLTALVVIVTANHYILDIVAAALVTGLGIAGAALLQQSRSTRPAGGQGT